MQKNRKYISAIMAGLTLFSIAPVKAEPELIGVETVSAESPAQLPSPFETGNYRDLLMYVGMLGAVVASVGVVFYLKKKNEYSED